MLLDEEVAAAARARAEAEAEAARIAAERQAKRKKLLAAVGGVSGMQKSSSRGPSRRRPKHRTEGQAELKGEKETAEEKDPWMYQDQMPWEWGADEELERLTVS